MLYYRVVEHGKVFRHDGYLTTIGGELFTVGEIKRYSVPDKYGQRLHPEWLEPVQVSHKTVYFGFGARFADGMGPT